MRNVSQIVNGKRKIIKKPELLAPAGNLEKLKTAIMYGADAVFVGGKEFSLRSQASNFSIEDIKEGVIFAKKYGAHIHVTCNIILHQDNLKGIEEYLQTLDDIGVTAIIVADPYIMKIAKDMDLNLEVHVSTQLSTLNLKAIEFYQKMGMDRVVLGREVTYEDLKTIMEYAPVDVEYFIHGAMCIHYSGRCMLSNYLSRRDANRGGCSQSCRWYYDLYDDGNLVNQEDDMPFSMSSKDMSLIDHIGELIELGVDSFKIEGRMKSLHYIATVVSTYRKLIDTYCEDPDHFIQDESYRQELLKAANRALCHGFFYEHPGVEEQLFNMRDEHPTQEFVMRILDYDQEKHLAKIEQRNYFKVGDQIEIFSPHHPNLFFTVEKLYNEDKEAVEVANHPMEILYVEINENVLANDMGRKVIR
ncbi:MAG: U32 family peptidase [Longibaculum muris]|uniref:Putative protease n=1 Tax=Longibaculum muris TaxID=1796628 RepID=A0A4R3Z8Q7_9FIRM|nr:U32 family peptidase [Longibaculum muris]KXU46446.1 peptidase, U32 family [Candidatus Stoquefichus sp. KLE1796]MBS5369297.1 U32 family peptidase [Coprobacillus cateniformis]MCR1886428.1 U32 family peptidase [Longibaculum muris]MED9811000.1 U32 family peptidase [Longibaculum muris]TCW02775.1 putative protease [Longibaculum muris]